MNKKVQIEVADRLAYQAALQRLGVPGVYAYMASMELTTQYERRTLTKATDARRLIWSGFVWMATTQGHEFWEAVAREAA